MPAISVVMSVFNNEAEVAEAIDSVLAQSFKDFEFLIIDDASTDNSKEIIQSYVQLDSRVQLIENEVNLKLAASLNKGISLAKGEFIARMDADDVALPERFKTQIDFMQSNINVAVCGTWVKLYEHPNIVWKTRTQSQAAICATFFESCFHHPTVMIRKSVLQEFGMYDETIQYAQDCHLWSSLAFDYNQTLCNIGQVHLRYRSHPEKAREQYRIDQYDNATELRKKNLSRLHINPSKSEYQQHDILCCAKRIKTRKDFEALINWMDFLEAENKRLCLLPLEQFSFEIEDKFLGVCLASAPQTLFAAWYYFKKCGTQSILKNTFRSIRMVALYFKNF